MSKKYRRSGNRLPKYVTELFGGHWRYTVSDFEKGPIIDGYSQEAAYVNKVSNYTTADMTRIGNITTLWHGTSKEALPYIASDCLLPGSWGLFGGGIYTAPHHDKASRFAGHGKKYLLKCRGAMGRPIYPTSNGSFESQVDGVRFHCVHARRGRAIFGVWSGSLVDDEIVFYNPNQVVVDTVFVYAQKTSRTSKKKLSKHQRNAAKKTVNWRMATTLSQHPCRRGIVVCGSAYGSKGCYRCISSGLRKNSELEDPNYCPLFTEGTVKKKRT